MTSKWAADRYASYDRRAAMCPKAPILNPHNPSLGVYGDRQQQTVTCREMSDGAVYFLIREVAGTASQKVVWTVFRTVNGQIDGHASPFTFKTKAKALAYLNRPTLMGAT